MNTHSDVAVDTGVPRSAEARVVVKPRLVLAHRPLRARVVRTVRLLLLTVDPGIPVGALTPVTLRQVYARGSVVTRLRGTLVDVDLATPARKSSGAEALDTVTHRHAQASVLAHAVGTLHRLALFSTDRAWTVSVHVRRTLDAGGGTVLRLEEVLGTLCTRSQPRVGVHARRTLGSAPISTRCCRLVGEGPCRASLAVLVATDRRFSRVTVPGTLETRHETRRRVRAVPANRNTVVYTLGTFFSRVRAERTTQTRSLAVAVLVEAFGTRRTLFLLLPSERSSWTVHCGWKQRGLTSDSIKVLSRDIYCYCCTYDIVERRWCPCSKPRRCCK